MEQSFRQDTRRIDFLDGVRALSMLLVIGFHFWQQSWLQNVIPGDALAFLGVHNFSLTWVMRTGYMFVDVLILLSGFCLFLPYLSGTPDSLPRYFKKRAARILPSYYLCLLVFLVFFVRPSDYADLGAYFKDLLSHMTFTHLFTPETYLHTKYPGVLWTLGVEVQFYLIFPLVARVFRRFPLQSWAVMSLLAEQYIRLRAFTPDGADGMRINQLPAMLGVYANGMLAATLFCMLRARTRNADRARVRILATLVFFLCFAAIVCLLRDGLNLAPQQQRAQLELRFAFSLFVAAALLALDHAAKPLRFLFGCRPMRFLAAISYNLYIWHTTVALQLKAWRIPPYPEGGSNAFAWPQSAGGAPWHFAWQVQYTALIWLVSLVLAALLTYLWERPAARRILKK